MVITIRLLFFGTLIFLMMSIAQFVIWRGMTVAWLFTTEIIRLAAAFGAAYLINEFLNSTKKKGGAGNEKVQ